MFIDLDGFKQVNDRLGHAAGDTLLIEIAKRLKNSLRSSDTLARMGGDEFVVLLEQTGTDGEIAEVAQKLLTAIQAPFEAFGGERLVSASFGVAIYPVDAQDQQGLLTHADSAMYRAKASAESHVVFYRPPASAILRKVVTRIERDDNLAQTVANLAPRVAKPPPSLLAGDRRPGQPSMIL